MDKKWENSCVLLECPSCGKNMRIVEKSIICEKNHCFDISKKGYVNFIQKQNSKIYSTELFENRSKLYDHGIYNSILDAIEEMIHKYVCLETPISILDVGCGEGAFLTKLCNEYKTYKCGFDISKDAILLACKRSKSVLWLVADLANIPIKSNSIDVLLNIFTPANYTSFHRVLKQSGIMIKVVPGKQYLKEFRALAKESLEDKYNESRVIEYLESYMDIVEMRNVYYQVPVDEELVTSWAKMTPMLANKKLDINKLLNIKYITVDVNICVCKK